MTTVLVVGEAMVELSPAGDHRLAWTFAGDTLNCAAAIADAAPDARARYLTGLGDDPISTEFVEFCRRLGVDTTGAPVVPGHNLGLYWISTLDGERHFRYWRNESAARHALRQGIEWPEHPNPDAVVFSGITLAVAGTGAGVLLERIVGARAGGATVAYDTNHRPILWPDADTARHLNEQALATSDIIHASVDDTAALWGDDAEAFIARATESGATETIITDGPDRVDALVDGERLAVEPQVVPATDTTGAGDAFFGTYIGRRLAGDAAGPAIERAIAVAGVVVQSPGALGHLLDHRP
jgi:2-dehydro-3-deoxygluconokinase